MHSFSSGAVQFARYVPTLASTKFRFALMTVGNKEKEKEGSHMSADHSTHKR
jgi:hypothetical protein